MKILFRVITPMILLIACSPTRNDSSASEKDFKIVRLDSLKNVYLIYARQKDTLYKIVSLKNVSGEGRRLVVDSSYHFDLVSLFLRDFQGYDLSPRASLDIGGISFAGTVIKLERDSIADLYQAKNIKGLRLAN
jgi:hypothetical protein